MIMMMMLEEAAGVGRLLGAVIFSLSCRAPRPPPPPSAAAILKLRKKKLRVNKER